MPMTEDARTTPPDHLAVDPKSRYHDAAALERGVGVRFNGVEKTTVEEYCVAEGWIRVAVGKARDRHGNPTLLTLKGKVEPYFLDAPPDPTNPAGEAASGPLSR
jgi:Protein of unknown function (DUF3297)